MTHYESYSDVLTEHAARRHVFGASAVIVLLLAVALVAASVI